MVASSWRPEHNRVLTWFYDVPLIRTGYEAASCGLAIRVSGLPADDRDEEPR
jgi:hypothetical protein